MGARSAVLTDLVRSFDALRNSKAIVWQMAGFAISLPLIGIGAVSNSAAIFGPCALLTLITVLAGYSAEGVVLMDVTREKAPSSSGDAIVLGGFGSLKFIVGVLGLIVAMLGLHLVIVALL